MKNTEVSHPLHSSAAAQFVGQDAGSQENSKNTCSGVHGLLNRMVKRKALLMPGHTLQQVHPPAPRCSGTAGEGKPACREAMCSAGAESATQQPSSVARASQIVHWCCLHLNHRQQLPSLPTLVLLASMRSLPPSKR